MLGWCARAEELTGGWFDAWAMPGGVDPTGLLKGWAAQRAADTLRAAGPPAAMDNAAGDIASDGRPDVTGPDLTLADALAACGPPGLGWLTEVDGYEGLVIAPDARLSTTAGFELGR
jgi:hypothetical protein